jgi:hypothetical protein
MNPPAEPVSQAGGVWRVKKSKIPELSTGQYVELQFTPAGLRMSGAGRVAVTVRYGDVEWVPGRTLGTLYLPDGTLEVEQAGQETPSDLQELLAKWRRAPTVDPLADPATRPAVLVWSYPGRTQADAAVLFARHAQELATKGYRPTGQSWGEGRPGWARVLLISELAESIRPKGFLTVTYELSAATSPSPMAQQPDVIDQIRRLGELRDLGVLTGAEFEEKKADLLTRL